MKRLERSISAMVGKGSVNHNERKFTAENVDSDRTKDNIAFLQRNIKEIYHELFDEALDRFNAKQKRKDRMIPNYYEHIRKGKQEKTFHEVIFQIGNKDDMAVGTEAGEIAKQIFCEFVEEFREHNPNLRIFSAHLHMDEATPHIHIDFIPYITGSKRGLDTRVSMKQALAAQGFRGNGRSDTEYNQWINSEKEHLSETMLRYGVTWKRLGIHREHLSVLEFKKAERTREVKELDSELYIKELEVMNLNEKIYDRNIEISQLAADKLEVQQEVENTKKDVEDHRRQLNELAPMISEVKYYVAEYSENIERILPEAGVMESSKTYREKKVRPLIKKLIDVIQSIYAKYLDIKQRFERLQGNYDIVCDNNEKLGDRIDTLLDENEVLQQDAIDLSRVKSAFGSDRVMMAIETEKQKEQMAVATGRGYRR